MTRENIIAGTNVEGVPSALSRLEEQNRKDTPKFYSAGNG